MRAPLDSSHPAEAKRAMIDRERGRERERGERSEAGAQHCRCLCCLSHFVLVFGLRTDRVVCCLCSALAVASLLFAFVAAAAMPKAGGRPIQYADTRANTSYAAVRSPHSRLSPLKAKSARRDDLATRHAAYDTVALPNNRESPFQQLVDNTIL